MSYDKQKEQRRATAKSAMRCLSSSRAAFVVGLEFMQGSDTQNSLEKNSKVYHAHAKPAWGLKAIGSAQRMAR